MLSGAIPRASAIVGHRRVQDRRVERLHEERHRDQPRQEPLDRFAWGARSRICDVGRRRRACASPLATRHRRPAAPVSPAFRKIACVAPPPRVDTRGRLSPDANRALLTTWTTTHPRKSDGGFQQNRLKPTAGLQLWHAVGQGQGRARRRPGALGPARTATTAGRPWRRPRPPGPPRVPEAGRRRPPGPAARRTRATGRPRRDAGELSAAPRRGGPPMDRQDRGPYDSPYFTAVVLPRGHELQRPGEDDPHLGAHDRALRDRAHRPRQARPLRGRRPAQAPRRGRPRGRAPADPRLRPRRRCPFETEEAADLARDRRRTSGRSSTAPRPRSTRRRAISW